MYQNNFDPRTSPGTTPSPPLPTYSEQYPLQDTSFHNSPTMQRGNDPLTYPEEVPPSDPMMREPLLSSPDGPRSPFSRVVGGGGGVQFIEPQSPGPRYGEAPRRQPRRYKTGTNYSPFTCWLLNHKLTSG